MPTTFVTGDLFAERGLDGLAHGCNCAGAMGTGIAVDHDGIRRIGVPRIGAGLGGLEWCDVRAVLADDAGCI